MTFDLTTRIVNSRAMENTDDNGALVSEDKLSSTLMEGESVEIIVDASSERHRPSDEDNPGVTENGQALSDFEKSPPPGDGDTSDHTDGHTSPQPLVSDDDRPCEEEEREGEEGGINSLGETNKDVEGSQLEHYEELVRERDKLAEQLIVERQKGVAFQEIAKELEVKCFNQQEQLDSLQDQLDSERDEAGRRVVELEKELAIQLDKATALYKESESEKEGVIAKLGVLEEERKKLIEEITTAEQKLKETSRENEQLTGLTKKQKLEITKLRSDLEKSEAQCTKQSQELSKMKEEVSSLQIKVKWAQNKLKTETESHKETKSQLTVTSKKLKEAREEGEQIRTDLKTMIQQYQESEEMRSNSLDIKLKKTEKELKQHEQEIADQLELHELTVKELELTKTSHKIAQEEIKQHKQKLSAMTGQLAEQAAEIEELKGIVEGGKQDQKKLAAGKSEIEQLSQSVESERAKFAQLRETFTQLQKSHQHLEKEVAKRKERETEMLALTEKLSSSNAELQVERSERETKVSESAAKLEQMSAALSESQQKRQEMEAELAQLQESSKSEISQLYDRLEDKTKAVEQLSMALEDEREEIKVIRKKNSNNIRDLQRQLQQSKRRIDQLEMSIAAEKEPPATLPITEGSRASSHSSLDSIVAASGSHSNSTAAAPPPPATIAVTAGNVMTTTSLAQNSVPIQQQTPMSDEERLAASPSPELFQSMDQEKILLVEKMCRLKRELAKMDEKMAFYEEHATQLTEDIQRKSKIIQSFIMREQSGALAPPQYDEHKLKLVKKGGIMATVFTGKSAKTHKRTSSEMTLELSLEMNRKMQSVLEDTLLKNITLKENIDTLGKEIQRLSAQLQRFESSSKR